MYYNLDCIASSIFFGAKIPQQQQNLLTEPASVVDFDVLVRPWTGVSENRTVHWDVTDVLIPAPVEMMMFSQKYEEARNMILYDATYYFILITCTQVIFSLTRLNLKHGNHGFSLFYARKTPLVF